MKANQATIEVIRAASSQADEAQKNLSDAEARLEQAREGLQAAQRDDGGTAAEIVDRMREAERAVQIQEIEVKRAEVAMKDANEQLRKQATQVAEPVTQALFEKAAEIKEQLRAQIAPLVGSEAERHLGPVLDAATGVNSRTAVARRIRMSRAEGGRALVVNLLSASELL